MGKKIKKQHFNQRRPRDFSSALDELIEHKTSIPIIRGPSHKQNNFGISQRKNKPSRSLLEMPLDEYLDSTSSMLHPPSSSSEWRNRTRVLFLASAGITAEARHLLRDLRSIMPHTRRDSKLDRNAPLSEIAEICDLHHCSKALYVECRAARKGRHAADTYLWLASAPNGPTVKFHVENLHTMLHLNLMGNCLKSSRPLLSFDAGFYPPEESARKKGKSDAPGESEEIDSQSQRHLSLIRELLLQVFNTPRYHPASQPFIDHVLHFGLLDKRIWFRNYQIVDESGELLEIGPRCVLNPVKIYSGCFAGSVLFENNSFVPTNLVRRTLRERQLKEQWATRVASRAAHLRRERQLARQTVPPLHAARTDPTDALFDTL